MSFLANINLADATPQNFYAEQAASTGNRYTGISPNYYDHYRVDVSKGIFQFSKPVKGESAIEPFDPTNSFTLKDIYGNQVTHAFVGMEVDPIGYFIGAKLDNYNQVLPDERNGSHCETVRAELDLADGTTATVKGRYPLQSSQGVHFNFRAYDADKSAAGRYAGKRFMTYGQATPQYAAQANRPEVMNCGECLSKNLDRYAKNQCRTTGEFAVLVKRLAFKGAENKIIWHTIAELGLANFNEEFVAVLNLGASDLRKPEYKLEAKVNFHIPANVTFAHDYVGGLYRRPHPEFIPMVPTEYGIMQTLAYPSQVWVAELSKSYGANNYVALYNECPSNSQLDLTERHQLLDNALTAYFNERSAAAIKANPSKLQLLQTENGAAPTNGTAAAKIDTKPTTVPTPEPIQTALGTATISDNETPGQQLVGDRNLNTLSQISSLFSGFNAAKP